MTPVHPARVCLIADQPVGAIVAEVLPTDRLADFPADYATARLRFRAAAKRLGWTLEVHPIPGSGPDGEDLTIDAAISPHAEAGKVLVVSSGLHGAEGPFGSAVQLAAME